MYWTGTMSSVSEEKIARNTVGVAVEVNASLGVLPSLSLCYLTDWPSFLSRQQATDGTRRGFR